MPGRPFAIRIAAVLAAALLAIISPVGCVTVKDQEAMVTGAGNQAIPSIDAEAPTVTETATFALG